MAFLPSTDKIKLALPKKVKYNTSTTQSLGGYKVVRALSSKKLRGYTIEWVPLNETEKNEIETFMDTQFGPVGIFSFIPPGELQGDFRFTDNSYSCIPMHAGKFKVMIGVEEV